MLLQRIALLALLAVPLSSHADERELVTGDGRKFTLAFEDDLPARAENDAVVWEAAGFTTDTASARPTLTDEFAFVFKGGEQPVQVTVEDVTTAAPVQLLQANVPEQLEGAGFRRTRFTVRAPACAIARGEPCSAWMFGDQPLRLYRAEFRYADGRRLTLFQAEPYVMTSFIARLGDRIPDHSGNTAANP